MRKFSADDQRFVALEFAPTALSAEVVFKPESVAVADDKLRGGGGRSRRKVQLVGSIPQFLAERDNVVNRLSRSDRALRNIVDAVAAAAYVVLVLLRKIVGDRSEERRVGKECRL